MQTFEIETPDGRKFRIEAPQGATQEQVMAFVQQNETARAERIAAATAADQARIRQDFQDSMSTLDRVLIGAGRGFTDLGQGVKQLGLNAGAAIGLVDDKTAEDYNADVREEAAMFERDLGDSTAANIGRYGAQILATLPAGGAGAGYVKAGQTVGSQLLRAGAVGAASGGLTSGLNAVTEEGDYWGQKAQQVGTGAAFGGALGAAGQGGVRLLQGVANAPRGAVNAIADAVSPQTPQSFQVAINAAREAGDLAKVADLEAAAARAGETIGRAGQLVRGSTAANRRGDRIAEITGINLSPAQRSTGKVATQLENMARQSIFTRERMFKGDFQRARQMVNSIKRMAGEIGGESIAPETFAQRLQGAVKNMVTDLGKRRTEVAGGAYREIDRLAGNAAIVQTRNTLDEVARLADEFGDVSTADGQKIKAWAEGFFDRLSGDGSISPSRAIREIQGWEQAARTGSGLFEGIQDRTTAKTAASRLAKALMADLDETAASNGGSVGDALKRANTLWRQYSSEIDAIESSALGRIIGDDMVGELSGTAFNTTSPERVLKVLDGLTASELQVARDYIVKTNPQLWQQFQRTTLERAMDSARASAPSMGDRALPINAAAFVRELEGSSGKAAVAQQERLKVIFEGQAREKLDALMGAGRRMADSTGYNFSGTGAYNEASGVLSNLANLGRSAASQLGGVTGLQVVARNAQPGAVRAPLRMLEAPAWATRWAMAPGAGLAMAGGREAMDKPQSEEEALSLALAEYQRQQAGRSR